MKLTLNALQNKAWWQEHGYELPLYDIPRVRAATLGEPRWLHLGAGNIFRAFLAHAQQRLLNQRDAESGIIVAEGFDPEIIEKAYRPCDNLSVFVRLKGDRTLDKIVLASVVESLTMRDDFERLQAIAAAPSLQMISLTITEKGYAIKDRDGQYYPAVAADFKDGIARPQSYIDEVVNVRLPNPYIPDTPQRIATDTSQKLAIRFGQTIKAHGANATALTAIPLVLAGWCRYLLGVDDNGQPFECSPDPLLESAQAKLQGVHIGSDNLGNVRELLQDSAIFGVDLYAVGLGEKIEGYLREMLAGNGAVRATLQKHLA